MPRTRPFPHTQSATFQCSARRENCQRHGRARHEHQMSVYVTPWQRRWSSVCRGALTKTTSLLMYSAFLVLHTPVTYLLTIYALIVMIQNDSMLLVGLYGESQVNSQCLRETKCQTTTLQHTNLQHSTYRYVQFLNVLLLFFLSLDLDMGIIRFTPSVHAAHARSVVDGVCVNIFCYDLLFAPCRQYLNTDFLLTRAECVLRAGVLSFF